MPKARTCSALLLATFLVVLLAALVAGREARAAEPTLVWYGHSAFALTSEGGTVVVMDPVPDELGYRMPTVAADAVTVSHEHFDHLALRKVSGEPRVLRGLTADGRRCRPIDEQIGDVRVRTVAAWHDDDGGRGRGPSAIFVLETGGLVVVHLGDLGHTLDARQIEQIGATDVLLVPVGGKFALDARSAAEVVGQLSPRRYVVPMHFAVPALAMDLPLAGAEPFLKQGHRVERPGLDHLLLAPPSKGTAPSIVLLVAARAG